MEVVYVFFKLKLWTRLRDRHLILNVREDCK